MLRSTRAAGAVCRLLGARGTSRSAAVVATPPLVAATVRGLHALPQLPTSSATHNLQHRHGLLRSLSQPWTPDLVWVRHSSSSGADGADGGALEAEDGGALQVELHNGHRTLAVPLPTAGRTLFPVQLSSTVGELRSAILEEDPGVQTARVFVEDGTHVSQRMRLRQLLPDGFQLLVDQRKYTVEPCEAQEADEAPATLVDEVYTQLSAMEAREQRKEEVAHELEGLKATLAPLNARRAELEQKAVERTKALAWVGLAAMGLQFGFLARLTWWEYSWDLMEPVTYFITYGTSMGFMAYYVLSQREYDYETVAHRRRQRVFHKYAKANDFDVQGYNELLKSIQSKEDELKGL